MVLLFCFGFFCCCICVAKEAVTNHLHALCVHCNRSFIIQSIHLSVETLKLIAFDDLRPDQFTIIHDYLLLVIRIVWCKKNHAHFFLLHLSAVFFFKQIVEKHWRIEISNVMDAFSHRQCWAMCFFFDKFEQFRLSSSWAKIFPFGIPNVNNWSCRNWSRCIASLGMSKRVYVSVDFSTAIRQWRRQQQKTMVHDMTFKYRLLKNRNHFVNFTLIRNYLLRVFVIICFSGTDVINLFFFIVSILFRFLMFYH